MVEIGRTELPFDGFGDLVGVAVREKSQREVLGLSAQVGVRREKRSEQQAAFTACELVESRGWLRLPCGQDGQLQFAGRRAGNGGRHSQVRYAA